MARPKEPIFCHLDRPHFAKGLCESCYRKQQLVNLRNAVYALLGDRCSNPNCRYLNTDGTFGCSDKRLLQVDHINGGGIRERKELANNAKGLYRKILKDEGQGYRILCANCNWLHRFENF